MGRLSVCDTADYVGASAELALTGKTEIRGPKPGRRPKTEIRIDTGSLFFRFSDFGLLSAWRLTFATGSN